MKKVVTLTILSLMLVFFAQQSTLPVSAQPACGDANFLNVQPDPANSAYPDPEVDASCNATTMTVTSNGIPNYEFVQTTPNNLQAANNSFSIPLTPSGTQESIPLLGDAGVLVNGVPIFGPNEAANLGWGDPYLDGVLDFCNGHTGFGGAYHNHVSAECIFPNYEDNVGLVVGYSLDGWPILAPFECADSGCTTVVELASSWQVTDPNAQAAWDMHSYVAGSGDLDECNGKAQPDGSYAYYATATFPYFMGCYVHADFGVPTAAEMVYLPIVGNNFSATATVMPAVAALSGVTLLAMWHLRKNE